MTLQSEVHTSIEVRIDRKNARHDIEFAFYPRNKNLILDFAIAIFVPYPNTET